ncbi:DUF1794 family protein [Tieghemostelium lacteum]|uniref:DUF1794 family protein n=1 Tax=Tieghemostelium lacteum TaxID=361077 RepID=A0A151ZAP3_TIELA|nr:DUF1794 family protein [Tieghemostelium lacteum]|eukprot:KYQ91022.1 DUF1794 family protein [Tieghemostelium lacteum]
MATVHPNLTKLQWLIGTFKGKGNGIYPTIKPFTYQETIEFTSNGKPFLFYVQKTLGENGLPLHAESGYLRCPPNGIPELIISQPTGIADIYSGEITDNNTTLTFKLKSIQRTDSAKAPHTTDLLRIFKFDNSTNTLTCLLDMATETTPQLTRHLESHLVKQ